MKKLVYKWKFILWFFGSSQYYKKFFKSKKYME